MWNAEVINAIAFDMNLGALDYKEEEDGTVHLLRQELLEVVLLLTSALASALPPLEDLMLLLGPALANALAPGSCLVYCCCLVLPCRTASSSRPMCPWPSPTRCTLSCCCCALG